MELNHRKQGSKPRRQNPLAGVYALCAGAPALNRIGHLCVRDL